MNLKYYYWCFPKALSSKICDDIIAYGNRKKIEKGITGSGSVDGKDLTEQQKNIQKKLEIQT